MSARIFGGKLTIPAAADSLQNILQAQGRIEDRMTGARVSVRADLGNTELVWFGESDVTVLANQHGFLNAGEWVTIDTVIIPLNKFFIICASGASKVYVSGSTH